LLGDSFILESLNTSVINLENAGLVATLLSQDELEQLPLRYRLLVRFFLKLPNPSLPFFILRRFPEFEGILWAVVIPIILVLHFYFIVWLFPSATLLFGFPLNYIFGLMIPAMIVLFFLRIQLARVILWWRNVHEPLEEWDTSKLVEEWVQLLKQQQRRKKSKG
jgi:hypothetical protein